MTDSAHARQGWMVPGEVVDQLAEQEDSSPPCRPELFACSNTLGLKSQSKGDVMVESKVPQHESPTERFLMEHARSIDKLFTERLAEHTKRIIDAVSWARQQQHHVNETNLNGQIFAAAGPRSEQLASSPCFSPPLAAARAADPSPLPPVFPPPAIATSSPDPAKQGGDGVAKKKKPPSHQDPLETLTGINDDSDSEKTPSSPTKSMIAFIKSKVAVNEDEMFTATNVNTGCCSWVGRVIETRTFESLTSFCVVLNAISIGIQADWAMRNPEDKEQLAFDIVDYCFTSVFTIELCLRITAAGKQFLVCSNKDFNWNVIDSLLVSSAVFEVIAKHAEIQFISVSFMRAVRLLRLVRILRMLRVFRFFKDLRIMVVGILASMRPLFWALILLFLVMYVFAVGLMQIVVESYEDASDSVQEELTQYFGSLPRAIFTLFLCISGGIDWSDASAPLVEVSWVFSFAFSIYIAFCTMCVLNIVTGIFVENASQMSAKDDDLMLMDEIEKRKQWIQQVKELFESADETGEGELDWDEFSVQLKDIRVQRCLDKLGIDVNATSHESIFQQFDFDGSGTIAISEFTTSLMRLHGTARSLDIAELRHMLNGIKTDIGKISRIGLMMNLPRSAYDEVQPVIYDHDYGELV